MTNPDHVDNRALQAAQTIATQAGQLWMTAFADGVREGIAAAAACIDHTVNQMRDDYSIDSTVRVTAIVMGEALRDQLRLAALAIPEPALPPWQAQ